MPCHAMLCLEKMNVHRYVKSENVLGRDECRPKPYPQGFLLLMQRWGAAEADTVMVSIVCIHAGEQEREWGRQPHSTLWHQLNFNVLLLLPPPSSSSSSFHPPYLLPRSRLGIIDTILRQERRQGSQPCMLMSDTGNGPSSLI